MSLSSHVEQASSPATRLAATERFPASLSGFGLAVPAFATVAFLGFRIVSALFKIGPEVDRITDYSPPHHLTLGPLA